MVKRVINLKACPRCGGDLHVSADMYGDYAQCVQCGYMKDLEANLIGSRVLKKKTAKEEAA